MLFGEVFERFASASPVSVMARALFEYALPPALVDQLFDEQAQRQYTRELLFSQVVDLMSLVVCRIQPSLSAAIRKRAAELPVTRKAVYAKIGRTEPDLGAALVRRTATALVPVLTELGGAPAAWLPGYATRILDGNHLAGTEHRLRPLRLTRAAARPGQALVVFDPQLDLVVDAIPCEDGHAQERHLTPAILERIGPRTLWIADRNFCTTRLLFGIAARQGCFVIRQHGSTLTEVEAGPPAACGRGPSGGLSEQGLVLADAAGGRLAVRRVTVALDQPTRDGARVIHILTNLPAAEAGAGAVAALYRRRWELETAFQELEAALHGEVATLGYPKAALFAFCVALAAFNLLSALKAAVRSAHGAEAVAPGLSGYALASEVATASRGLGIALPPGCWAIFGGLGPAAVARFVRDLARRVRLAEFRKQPRGPKKPRPKRQSGARIKHVATARLLKEQAM